MSRIDDIINVAEHRLSTGRIEEVINKVPNVVESAVVAMKDDLKGELPFAFIVCKSEVVESDYLTITQNVTKEIVHSIGPISKLKGSLIVHKLPKTRSGKILRGVLKNIINGEKYKVPGTIEDINVLHEIIDLLVEQQLIKAK